MRCLRARVSNVVLHASEYASDWTLIVIRMRASMTNTYILARIRETGIGILNNGARMGLVIQSPGTDFRRMRVTHASKVAGVPVKWAAVFDTRVNHRVLPSALYEVLTADDIKKFVEDNDRLRGRASCQDQPAT